MALSVENSGGGQSTTQNPQIAGHPADNGASTGSIQPGTSNNLLTGQGTIPLSNTPLTTVSLSQSGSQATVKQTVPSAVHHWNPLLILITVLLLLIAAGSVLLINRSEKNTTY